MCSSGIHQAVHQGGQQALQAAEDALKFLHALIFAAQVDRKGLCRQQLFRVGYRMIPALQRYSEWNAPQDAVSYDFTCLKM